LEAYMGSLRSSRFGGFGSAAYWLLTTGYWLLFSRNHG
jgi:hypothetical protein